MKKIKIKTLYLIGIITIGLIGLGIGSTYAMFTSDIEIDNPISLSATLTSESDVIETFDIEVESNDIEVIELTIINGSTTSLNYSSFYITDNKDIEVGVTHNFSDSSVPTGNINNNENKKVYIQIKNNNSSKEKVTIGVLSNSGNIIKSDEMILVQDNNIDTTSPKILITGQDMIVKDGLIRYYNASNNLEYSHSSNTTTWKDLSGNYDGEVNNLTWNTNSTVFNGTSSHVRIGQINNLTAITVETFLKANSYSTADANQIISNYNSNGLVLQLNKGVPGFSIGSGKTIASDETIDLGVNHTITGTYDGSTVKLYVDGVLKKTLSSTAGISNPTDTTPMVIGCNPNTTGCDTHYTDADIYAVRIYNRALTETEIKQNMNADRISAGDKLMNSNQIFSIISNKRLNDFSENNITITTSMRAITNSFTKINDKHYIMDTSFLFSGGSSSIDYKPFSISIDNINDISGNKNRSTITYNNSIVNGGVIATTITKNTSISRTVTYTITFDDNMYGFTKDDITVSEGTKGTFTKVNQKTYTLVVTHASDGSKKITVNSKSCNDRFGNLNASKSLTHTIDSIKPTVTITKNTSTSRTVTYTFTFSEAVTGFTASSVTVNEGTKGTFTKVSDSKYTLVVTHASDGSKTITVAAGACKDSAGNGNTANTLTHTINTDTTKPTVTIKTSCAYDGGKKKYLYTVTFTWSENVYDFDASKVTINPCMTRIASDGTCSAFGINYMKTLTQVDQKTYQAVEVYSSSSVVNGLKVTIAAGACHDAAGNTNDAYTIAVK